MILTPKGLLSTIIRAGDGFRIETTEKGTRVHYSPALTRDAARMILGAVASYQDEIHYKNEEEANALVHACGGTIPAAEAALLAELERSLGARSNSLNPRKAGRHRTDCEAARTQYALAESLLKRLRTLHQNMVEEGTPLPQGDILLSEGRLATLLGAKKPQERMWASLRAALDQLPDFPGLCRTPDRKAFALNWAALDPESLVLAPGDQGIRVADAVL